MGLRSLALVSLFGLAACGGGGTATMQLYPLQGPIAADDPTLVIEAKAKNTDGTSGTLTFRLPGKVKCEGTWSSLTPRTISSNAGLSLTLRKTGGELVYRPSENLLMLQRRR